MRLSGVRQECKGEEKGSGGGSRRARPGQDAGYWAAAMHGGGGGCRLVSWAGLPRGSSGWWAGGGPTVGWEPPGSSRKAPQCPQALIPGFLVPPGAPGAPGELLAGTRLGPLPTAHTAWPAPLPGLQDAARAASSPPRLGEVGSCLRTQPQHLLGAGSGGGAFPHLWAL